MPSPHSEISRRVSRSWNHANWKAGGWGGIRTHGEREPTPVFKTGALNHSATHPLAAAYREGKADSSFLAYSVIASAAKQSSTGLPRPPAFAGVLAMTGTSR